MKRNLNKFRAVQLMKKERERAKGTTEQKRKRGENDQSKSHFNGQF